MRVPIRFSMRFPLRFPIRFPIRFPVRFPIRFPISGCLQHDFVDRHGSNFQKCSSRAGVVRFSKAPKGTAATNEAGGVRARRAAKDPEILTTFGSGNP